MATVHLYYEIEQSDFVTALIASSYSLIPLVRYAKPKMSANAPASPNEPKGKPVHGFSTTGMMLFCRFWNTTWHPFVSFGGVLGGGLGKKWVSYIEPVTFFVICLLC